MTEVTDAMHQRLAAIGLSNGEFFVNGDTFDLIFAPGGTSFLNAHKIVGRFACGDTAYKLPDIVAELLNGLLAASPRSDVLREEVVAKAGEAVAAEIDAIDDELANCVNVLDREEWRKVAAERIARAALASTAKQSSDGGERG